MPAPYLSPWRGDSSPAALRSPLNSGAPLAGAARRASCVVIVGSDCPREEERKTLSVWPSVTSIPASSPGCIRVHAALCPAKLSPPVVKALGFQPRLPPHCTTQGIAAYCLRIALAPAVAIYKAGDCPATDAQRSAFPFHCCATLRRLLLDPSAETHLWSGTPAVISRAIIQTVRLCER